MLNGPETTGNGVTQIRDIALLPGETIGRVFTQVLGLTDQPPATGQLLVATNQRVLAFCRNDGRNETFLVPMAELKTVAVSARKRTAVSIAQGVLLSLGGVLLYMAAAYWLTGRFDGPSIPVLNMDLAPFLALLIGLAVLAAIGRHYLPKKRARLLSVAATGSSPFRIKASGPGGKYTKWSTVSSLPATRSTVTATCGKTSPEVDLARYPAPTRTAPPSGIGSKRRPQSSPHCRCTISARE